MAEDVAPRTLTEPWVNARLRTGGELQTLLGEAGPPGELTHLARVMRGYGKDEFRPQEPLDAETSLWGRPCKRAICP